MILPQKHNYKKTLEELKYPIKIRLIKKKKHNLSELKIRKELTCKKYKFRKIMIVYIEKKGCLNRNSFMINNASVVN